MPWNGELLSDGEEDDSSTITYCKEKYNQLLKGQTQIKLIIDESKESVQISD